MPCSDQLWWIWFESVASIIVKNAYLLSCHLTKMFQFQLAFFLPQVFVSFACGKTCKIGIFTDIHACIHAYEYFQNTKMPARLWVNWIPCPNSVYGENVIYLTKVNQVINMYLDLVRVPFFHQLRNSTSSAHSSIIEIFRIMMIIWRVEHVWIPFLMVKLMNRKTACLCTLYTIPGILLKYTNTFFSISYFFFFLCTHQFIHFRF